MLKNLTKTQNDKIDELLEVYTKKQLSVLLRAARKDFFMMILHGAVRSGKTVVNNDIFLKELQRVKKIAKAEGVRRPHYIVAAYSASTLQTNILDSITEDHGIEFNFDKHGNFELFGVKVVTTYTSSIRGLGAIRGMTAYGAYINEASLSSQYVFDEIIKRCSGLGARIIADTNPDHPEHWLKKDYIDEADDDSIVQFNFTLFDNDFLNQRYIDNLIKTTPSGTLTDRSIYGKWTIGKGAIYSDFNADMHIVDSPDVQVFDRFIVGVDWGYEHIGTMEVVGITPAGEYYLIEEHAHQHTHIDEWERIAKEIAGKYGLTIPFYCDSARPEYVDQLYYAGLNAMNAAKAVVPGISELGSLIKQGLFYSTPSAPHFNKEINMYVWNKTGDAPLKENDDSMDAVRYAVYTDKIMQEQGFS